MAKAVRDEWKEVWDWAHEVFGGPNNREDGYSFSRFFQALASYRAESEGWGECGSSDVWHASYGAVKYAKEKGEVKDRAGLIKFMRGWVGYYEPIFNDKWEVM